MNLTYLSPSSDPRVNLARDEAFLNRFTALLPKGGAVFYLYRNAPSVIIGVNQNPFRECDLSAMERDGVLLTRRMSGGGAVYHDGGNLNYSFIMREEDYDADKENRVILAALSAFGIQGEANGRNDLTAEGKKFSGTAYTRRQGVISRHGTLLVDTDLSALAGYLTVSPQKLAAKGVASVKSRVINLCELSPQITLSALEQALLSAFFEEYGESAPLAPSALPEAEWAALQEEIAALTEKNRSEGWLFGKTPLFSITETRRLAGATFELSFEVEAGRIKRAALFTDALETDIPTDLTALLVGLPYREDTSERLFSDPRFPYLI